jgi:hypothetical protein
MALDEADRVVVRRLAALLRVAEGLDADHFQVVEEVEVFQAEFGRQLVPVATEVV